MMTLRHLARAAGRLPAARAGTRLAVASVPPAALFSASSEASAAQQKGVGGCQQFVLSPEVVVTVAAYGLDKDTADESDRLRVPAAPTNVAAAGLDLHREMGEDAVMVASGTGSAALAVCDGVGGWRSAGVDPGIVSHLLCSYMREGAQGDQPDPVRLLDAAYEQMVAEAKRTGVVGSTTACVAVLEAGEGPTAALRAVNVGDSCLVVVRGRKAEYVTPETVHGGGWNPPPFQLAALTEEHRRRGCCSDRAADGAVGSATLAVGDTVVLGSDGLIDNVPPELVAEVVGRTTEHIGESVTGKERAETIGRTLLAAAVLSGRKVDDISVVVAAVEAPAAPQARL